MPALLIRTSRGPYRRRTRSAPAAPLPSSVTSIRTYPAPSPSEAGCPAAASRAAEHGGMAGGEKRAGRLAAEPLLAPVIRGDGSGGDELLDDTSIAWWGADGPGFDRRSSAAHARPPRSPSGLPAFMTARTQVDPRFGTSAAHRLPLPSLTRALTDRPRLTVHTP